MSDERMKASAPMQTAVETLAQPPAEEVQQSSTAEAPAPVQLSEDAFWSRTEKMFQRERNFMTEALDNKLAAEDDQVIKHIRDERMKRQELGDNLESNIEGVLQRVAELELEKGFATQATPTKTCSWVANHIIFEGWAEAVSNGERIADIESLLRLLPAGTQRSHLMRWAPKRSGPSIKTRWGTMLAAASAQFLLSQKMRYGRDVDTPLR